MLPISTLTCPFLTFSKSACFLASESASPDRCTDLAAAGAVVLRLPEQGGRIRLRCLMEELARRELSTVLVEGGAELAAGLLEEDLVDRVIFFIAPKLLGGRSAPGVPRPGQPPMLRRR